MRILLRLFDHHRYECTLLVHSLLQHVQQLAVDEFGNYSLGAIVENFQDWNVVARELSKDPMEVLQFATDRYASKLMQKVIELCAPVGLRSVLRQESIRVLDGSEHGLGFLKALLTSTAFRQETITSLQRAGLAERWLVSAVDSSFEILTAFKQQIRTETMHDHLQSMRGHLLNLAHTSEQWSKAVQEAIRRYSKIYPSECEALLCSELDGRASHLARSPSANFAVKAAIESSPMVGRQVAGQVSLDVVDMAQDRFAYKVILALLQKHGNTEEVCNLCETLASFDAANLLAFHPLGTYVLQAMFDSKCAARVKRVLERHLTPQLPNLLLDKYAKGIARRLRWQ